MPKKEGMEFDEHALYLEIKDEHLRWK